MATSSLSTDCNEAAFSAGIKINVLKKNLSFYKALCNQVSSGLQFKTSSLFTHSVEKTTWEYKSPQGNKHYIYFIQYSFQLANAYPSLIACT